MAEKLRRMPSPREDDGFVLGSMYGRLSSSKYSNMIPNAQAQELLTFSEQYQELQAGDSNLIFEAVSVSTTPSPRPDRPYRRRYPSASFITFTNIPEIPQAYFFNQVSAETTYASVAVLNVGWITG